MPLNVSGYLEALSEEEEEEVVDEEEEEEKPHPPNLNLYS